MEVTPQRGHQKDSRELIEVGTVLSRNHLMTRRLNISDLPSLIALDTLATYQQNPTPIDHSPPPLSLEILQGRHQTDQIIGGIFESSGNMIAYYIFDLKESELYIDSIAVASNHRNLGLGTCLLKIAHAEAGNRGLHKCTLSVDPLNGSGVNTYLKCGYQVTGYRRAYFGNEYPNTHRLWMELQLNLPLLLGNEVIKQEVGDLDRLESYLNSGYVGVALERSPDKDD
ncbi:MAG: GNAT family N-acetyltransferase, partial [Candidatus Roizmanbacteria bacterium]